VEPLIKITPKTIVSPDELCCELDRTRQRGCAVADETLEIGLVV